METVQQEYISEKRIGKLLRIYSLAQNNKAIIILRTPCKALVVLMYPSSWLHLHHSMIYSTHTTSPGSCYEFHFSVIWFSHAYIHFQIV